MTEAVAGQGFELQMSFVVLLVFSYILNGSIVVIEIND
jgi:hypothetical protein